MRDEYRADFDEGRGGFGKQLLQKIERDTLRAQRQTPSVVASAAAVSVEAGEVVAIAPAAGAIVPGVVESEMKPL